MTRQTISLHRQYGPIVRLSPGCLAVDGSIAFPQIFQHKPGRQEWSKLHGFYHDGDHMSLIGGTHENHRRLRRQLNHAFSDSSMYEQEPVVNQYVEMFCARLSERAATGETFDIVKWFNFMTFDIIGDLMFADSFHSLDGGNYHPWVLGVFEGIRGFALRRALLQYPFIGPLLTRFGSSAKFIAKEAENRRLAAEKAMLRKAQGETPGDRRDFMTYMLKKNREGEPGFSDMDILMNSPLLVTAGSETTATTLSSLFFHLGLPQNRGLYATLVKEIHGAFKHKDEIDMKATARLPYLNGCIEEVLRIYPAAPETPPRVSPGAELNGEFIPKGTLVSVFQLGTNHNPANFADPDSFRPERWLPSSHPLYNPMFANDNRASFRPFSYGTRDCLGKNLAYSEMRVVVARILLQFDYELAPGQEGWIDGQNIFILWEKPELKVIFKERQLAAE